ncbi:MAG: zf-HC2 domain-containing protein [Balneolaceae bacterium]|nr:MAG: zf-HC2 domain-containing protein [Balneolaceae bacterium]
MNMHKPGNEDLQRLMMAVLDGEATPAQEDELNRHLNADAQLRREFDELKSIKHTTMKTRLTEPDSTLWTSYWMNTYTRIERGLGWILFSAGAILLIMFGAWELTKEWLTDPGLPVWVKTAGILLGAGTIILLVSVIREKLFLHKNERYKDIQR